MTMPIPIMISGLCFGTMLSTSSAVAAAGVDKACGLVTPAELETVLGAPVSISAVGGMSVPGVDLCSGKTPAATVVLRLRIGLDPGRDVSGSKEVKGIEMARQKGIHVDVKTFGPITCSILVPPANLTPMGFNTTCTVIKDTAVAGIEVQAKDRKDMIPIEQLHPLAEKMAERF